MWGSDKSGLRAEIKVKGFVVGRAFNGGGSPSNRSRFINLFVYPL